MQRDLEDFFEPNAKRARREGEQEFEDEATCCAVAAAMKDAKPPPEEIAYPVPPPDGVAPRVMEVLSASRRTDIPGVKEKLDGLAARIRDYGWIDVHFNARFPDKTTRICLMPGRAKAIVFWSKDYGHFIESHQTDGESWRVFRQFALVFNFTVNSDSSRRLFEKGLKRTLADSLEQLAYLALNFDPDSIVLRFDPIVVYRTPGRVRDTADDGGFEQLCAVAAQLGIRSIYIAFCRYSTTRGKVPIMRRMAESSGVEPLDVGAEHRRGIAERMLRVAGKHGVQLLGCDSAKILGDYGSAGSIGQATCVEAARINRAICRTSSGQSKMLISEKVARKKDGGQRGGCQCMPSGEVGEYLPPCPHACAFCYGSPVEDLQQ